MAYRYRQSRRSGHHPRASRRSRRYGAAPVKGNAPMPSCGTEDQQKILDAITRMSGEDRKHCERLAESMGGIKELCTVLHAMRRWYTNQTWNVAKKVIDHIDSLSLAMDTSPPVGAFRGFKVDTGNRYANWHVGQVVTIPVTRNGGCSSWTMGRDLANRFSGSPTGKVGLVVQLVGAESVKTFIAPPERCRPWFNKLYAATMGTSHRHNEREYAIYAPKIRVKVIAVKGKGSRRGSRPRLSRTLGRRKRWNRPSSSSRRFVGVG